METKPVEFDTFSDTSIVELIDKAYNLAKQEYDRRHSNRVFPLFREATKYALMEGNRQRANAARVMDAGRG